MPGTVMGDFTTKPRKTTQVKAPLEKTTPRAPLQQTTTTGGTPPPPPPAPPPGMPTSSGTVESVTPPSPKPPGISAWLAGDEAFQAAQRGSQRTLSDLLSDLTRRRGETDTAFDQTRETAERGRDLGLDRMLQEFASRGMIHSGLFGQEQGRFQEDFQRDMERREQQRGMILADLLAQETNAKRQQENAMEVARMEALNRRAQRFNLTS